MTQKNEARIKEIDEKLQELEEARQELMVEMKRLADERQVLIAVEEAL